MNKTKQQVSVLFMLFSILFCVCLIAANILETKQISVLGISLTGGLIVFPVSYIINDCVCEVWGFKKARLLIWTGFAMNFFFVSVGALCDWIPGAPYWNNQEGFHAIFGLAPRVAAASFVAFIIGSFANAYVMSKMKIHDGGKRFSLRAILSTVAGETCDSIIFFPLALGGVVPANELPKLMLWQVLLKTIYEVIALPMTIRIVKKLKEHEGEDVYDTGVNYSIWKIFNLS
ncbi:putative membrane protein [Prevotella disiens JCM 6334 = ATCC 29426]|uniref:Probable queuosine precursor transporter n=3 Tax=Prevotella disiens TaxID=28130 RepID=E1KUQ8_9BACT|nr:queuosine precursor transporter [Prevotella disiens]EFL44814.1 putative membrane protein [Prevotella disiens FB035-09AN]ERJ74989.1 putative membrane protein [Prevotella disiens JCM 6334 = ATCC 29426]SUB84963.1 Inner membrane protein yhhQ [Prevotella disiens]